jgi:NAD(P)-dependent dehydrogenase (short-subunit alcohol dehydrogenase family)
MNVSIVGCGDLAAAFIKQTSHNVVLYKHEDYDLTQQDHCQLLCKHLVNADAVVITAGVFDSNLWNMWLVNTVAPSYIICCLNDQQYKGRIIIISSNGANWTSWPEISQGRLVYNNSKQAISKFVAGIEHSENSGRYTVIEPSKFQSKMSQYQGSDIIHVVDAIEYALANSVTKITLPSPKQL